MTLLRWNWWSTHGPGLRRRCAFLVRSGLFDAAWYIKTYPDVAKFKGGDAPAHYLLHGAAEGRSPGPLFDEKWYAHKNADVAAVGIDGLTHYIKFGASEGRDPLPLFDSGWYCNQSSDMNWSKVDPLTHYMRLGYRLGLSPSPLFNVDWYNEQAPDLAASGLDPISHYYKMNTRETRSPNPFFDTRWYLRHNKDAAAAAEDPFSHYLINGARGGASPSAFFDAQWYRDINNDVARVGAEPLTHFLRHGAREGRGPNRYFDTDWYVERYGNESELEMNPAEHYLRHGVAEGHDPSPIFNARWYRRTYIAKLPMSVDPLSHYIESGIYDGCVPSPGFELPAKVKYVQTVPGRLFREYKLSAWGQTSWRVPGMVRFDFEGLDINGTNIRAQRDNAIWRKPLRELLYDDSAFLIEPLGGAELWLEVRNSPSGADDVIPCLHARHLTAAEKLALRYEANQNMSRFTLAPVEPYKNWRDLYDTFDARERHVAQAYLSTLPKHPLISIIVPVYNTNAIILTEMIHSVKQQVYTNWELCIADDASTLGHVRTILEAAAREDPRVKLCFRQRNGHICEASNSALELVEGEYVALLDHDDLLAPHALAMLLFEINNRPDAEIFYSDHDHIDARGELVNPYFKPDWNPELFLASELHKSLMCLQHTPEFERSEAFEFALEGSQDLICCCAPSKERAAPSFTFLTFYIIGGLSRDPNPSRTRVLNAPLWRRGQQ